MSSAITTSAQDVSQVQYPRNLSTKRENVLVINHWMRIYGIKSPAQYLPTFMSQFCDSCQICTIQNAWKNDQEYRHGLYVSNTKHYAVFATHPQKYLLEPAYDFMTNKTIDDIDYRRQSCYYIRNCDTLEYLSIDRTNNPYVVSQGSTHAPAIEKLVITLHDPVQEIQYTNKEKENMYCLRHEGNVFNKGWFSFTGMYIRVYPHNTQGGMNGDRPGWIINFDADKVVINDQKEDDNNYGDGDDDDEKYETTSNGNGDSYSYSLFYQYNKILKGNNKIELWQFKQNQRAMIVKEWLETLGIGQYFDLFLDNGIDRMWTVKKLTNDNLKEIGVKLGHRFLLCDAILNLNEKQPPK